MLKFSSEICLKNKHILLVSIVGIGAFLRFWNLGHWSFWIDEVLSVLDAQELSLTNTPINPIPYLATKLSVFLSEKLPFFIGGDEWNNRLIFCIAGILSILVIFKLAQTLYDRKVGLLAATFVALSNWHLFWSQNSRSYILTFLFAALVAWFFYQSLENDSTLLTLCALFFSICLILSHLLSATIIPALGVYAIFRLLEHNHRKRILNQVIFFLPFALPLLLLLVPQIRNHLFSGWGHNEWGRSPIYIILTIVQGVSIPIAVTAFIAGVANRNVRSTRFLLCFAGIPLILLIIASQFQNVAGYYLFWTTSAFFILSAVACVYIWDALEVHRHTVYKILLPMLLIVGLLSQDYLYFRYENGGRPKWKTAFNYINSQMEPTDKVVLSETRMGSFYLPGMETVYVGELLDNPEEFERGVEANSDRIWFLVDVASFNVFDANQKVRNWIRRRARMVNTLPAYSRAKDRTIHIYLLE